MTPQPYLKFEQIGMSFRRGQMATEVLRDVNLRIEQGDREVVRQIRYPRRPAQGSDRCLGRHG